MDQVLLADRAALVVEVAMDAAGRQFRVLDQLKVGAGNLFALFARQLAHLVLHLGGVEDGQIGFQQLRRGTVLQNDGISSRLQRLCVQALRAQLGHLFGQGVDVDLRKTCRAASAVGNLGVAVLAGDNAD